MDGWHGGAHRQQAHLKNNSPLFSCSFNLYLATAIVIIQWRKSMCGKHTHTPRTTLAQIQSCLIFVLNSILGSQLSEHFSSFPTRFSFSPLSLSTRALISKIISLLITHRRGFTSVFVLPPPPSPYYHLQYLFPKSGHLFTCDNPVAG